MRRSLQFRLSAWLSALITIMAAMGTVVAFKVAFHEANEVQDGQLLQVAALITPHMLDAVRAEAGEQVAGADPESKLVIQTMSDAGPVLLPATSPDGLQNATADGVTWRVVIKTLADGKRVLVGQKTVGRDEIARNSALATIMPFAVLVPLLLVALRVIVSRMFRPLAMLSNSLDVRPDHDLSPLSGAQLPSEITPFVVAINRLLMRVSASVALQRRFIADAAHELRSPLTALSLQAERLDACELSSAARERVDTMRRGLRRTRDLLNQLLTFARLQGGHSEQEGVVRMQEVYRNVLEELMPLAEARRIDIGVSSDAEVTVNAPYSDMLVLVRNIVDNAIRYTPEDGRVDLSMGADAGQAWIRVEDTGPGIRDEDQRRVFDPFYRVRGNDAEGSGLGLSIVSAIVARLRADIELLNVKPAGLVVTVRFERSRE